MTPPVAVGVVLGQARLLDQPARVASTRYGATLVVAQVEDLRDLLVGLERQQVRDVLPARVAPALGQLVRLRPVDPALGW